MRKPAKSLNQLCSNLKSDPLEAMQPEKGNTLFPAGNLFPEYDLNTGNRRLSFP
jgi:hypothetical protein